MMVGIVGPVERPWRTLPSWVTACYDLIVRTAESINANTLRPEIKKKLDVLNPKDFTVEIQNRIQKYDRVVAVFLPNDPSVPVECVFAASLGKRVLVIHSETYGLPRILEGWAGISSAKWDSKTGEVVLNFLKL